MEGGMWDIKGKWADIKDKKVRETVRCKFKSRAAKAAGHLLSPRMHQRGVSGTQPNSKAG